MRLNCFKNEARVWGGGGVGRVKRGLNLFRSLIPELGYVKFE